MSSRSKLRAIGVGLFVGCLAACGGGGSSAGPAGGGVVGSELLRPDGSGTYFLDPHRGGKAGSIKVEELFWGRLVDVHDLDPTGEVVLDPIYRDFLINENVRSDPSRLRLEVNPISQKTKLVILRQRTNPEFLEILRPTTENLPPVLPKHDDGSSPPPFSYVARNACLAIRFDDLLDDGQEARLNLSSMVQLTAGYPPLAPQEVRILFDPNHGGVAGESFHSTRLMIDFTVSDTESRDMFLPVEVNSLGLPASIPAGQSPNITLRMPTTVDFGSGQFRVLRNLKGKPLSSSDNGPIAFDRATQDVVRAMRSGNPEDVNNGFLLDLVRPELVGTWPITLDRAVQDPAGRPGFEFLVDLSFTTPCLAAPEPGDIITVGENFLEVISLASLPDVNGAVPTVKVRTLTESSVQALGTLVGTGLYLSTFDKAKGLSTGCWVSFTPRPNAFPSDGVASFGQARVRFTEPMDPLSFKPFDTFMIVRGSAGAAITPRTLVIGEVSSIGESKDFTFTPTLPFDHGGNSDLYFVQIVAGEEGVTDLAGNSLPGDIPQVEFTIARESEILPNGGVVLRFNDTDEIDPVDLDDMRGQFLYDIDAGVLRPRPVMYLSAAVDRQNPVPSVMIPFAPGVQTPLTPLGSKLHALWRYADMGWLILDETKYNIDVAGLSWAPVGGQIVGDFYEQFEIRLAHSRKLPDETFDINRGAKYGDSGLAEAPVAFTDNILKDPVSPQKIVHDRNLGYRIVPGDIYLGVSGRKLVPFPLNLNNPDPITYTWRDTAILARDGPNGRGIPLDVEEGPPLFLEEFSGSVAPAGSVPSIGLPLLMEFRCYPSNSGIGLNSFDISLALNTSSRPNFRSYSTGGIDPSGAPVTKNPDLETVPSGAFNPSSKPPGMPTNYNADNALYTGQLDYVVRVSRAVSVWIDTRASSPVFSPPVVDPMADDLPLGTSLLVEFRGATGFGENAGTRPFNSLKLDLYGEIRLGDIFFKNGDSTWTSDLQALDGSTFIQFRVTFMSNVVQRLEPELSSIGFAFLRG